MSDFVTDGATLPKFFRNWIVKHYPPWVIERIDRGGRFHDYLAWKYTKTAKHNRRRFIKLLRRYGIPLELRIMINFGLWVFDSSPPWLQKKWQATAK